MQQIRTVEDQIKQGITTTLDEPVSETIKRDLNQIKEKLIVVLMPLSQDAQENVLHKLKDWDLWGPLVVCLSLSILLSISAPTNSASVVFAAVFVIVWLGAGAVSLNAQLLGGTISFFQVSLSLLSSFFSSSSFIIFIITITECMYPWLLCFPSDYISSSMFIFWFIFKTDNIEDNICVDWFYMEHSSISSIYDKSNSRREKTISCVSCVFLLYIHSMDDITTIVNIMYIFLHVRFKN